MNIDATINRDKHQVGLEVVIRDGDGSMKIAAVNHTMFYGDIAQAKAIVVNL